MTLYSTTLKTTAVDTDTTDLTIGDGATIVNLGGSSNIISLSNIVTQTVKQKVYYVSSQIFSPTVTDFLANGTIVIFTYGLQNPSTSNEVITINLPTPTAQLDGACFIFRKIRGIYNTSNTNMIFNTSPASILEGTGSLTKAGQPIALVNLTSTILRAYVMSYASTYVWVMA